MGHDKMWDPWGLFLKLHPEHYGRVAQQAKALDAKDEELSPFHGTRTTGKNWLPQVDLQCVHVCVSHIHTH